MIKNHRYQDILESVFLKIANHLSYKPNFVNYMFKDDMICDGISVRYIHNFQSRKNPKTLLHTLLKLYTMLFLKDITREKAVRNKE